MAPEDKPRIILNIVPNQKVGLVSYIAPFNSVKLEKYLSWTALDHGYYYIENLDDPNKDVRVEETYIRPAPHTKDDLNAFITRWRKMSAIHLTAENINELAAGCLPQLPK